jgi:hypothetical protein
LSAGRLRKMTRDIAAMDDPGKPSLLASAQTVAPASRSAFTRVLMPNAGLHAGHESAVSGADSKRSPSSHLISIVRQAMANLSIARSKNFISHYKWRIGSVLVLMTAASVSFAQVLPVPTRTVYKCNVNGKTSYSDSPCVGAQRLDIEPSRGVGKSAGHDVQRERHRELLAEAVRPLTGMDAKQFDTNGRRMKLSAETRRECRALDTGIADAERDEARSNGELRNLEKVRLFGMRQRQRDLRC